MKSWLKATLAATVSVTIAVSLTGCSNTNPTASSTTFVPHIAVIMGTTGPAYAATLKAEAQAAAKKFGAVLDWHGETLNGTAKAQQALVYNAAKNAVQGIILMPVDNSLQAYVDLAGGLGSDVVMLDSHVLVLDHVLANVYDDSNQGGIKLADAIADSINYQKGKDYQIAVGVNNPKDQVTKVRLAGFNYELGAKYPGIKVVATASSSSDANKAGSAVAKAFQSNPKLAGFVALDEFTATAAANYVQTQKVRIPLVAYDTAPSHVELLKKGIFTHLLSQNPKQKITAAIAEIVAHQMTGAKPVSRDSMFESVMLDKSSSKADLKKFSYLTPVVTGG